MKIVLFLKDDKKECVYISEEGGVACAHFNGDMIISEYYQDRLSKKDLQNNDLTIWEILGEGKMYGTEWPNKTRIDQEVLEDLRESLVSEEETEIKEYPMNWQDMEKDEGDYPFLQTFLQTFLTS
jgi:hypothetical protein